MGAKKHYIFNIPPGAPVTVRVFAVPEVGDTLVKWCGRLRFILQHWGKDNGIMCRLTDCKLCKQPGPAQRLVGFAPALVWRQGQYQDWAPVALQVTEALQESTQDNVLWGTTWRLWRELGESGKVECKGEQVEDGHPDQCPPEWDVSAAICTAYKTNRVFWVPAPLRPARLVLSSSALPAPPIRPNQTPAAVEQTTQRYTAEQFQAWKEKHGLRNTLHATKEQLAELIGPQ